MTGIGTKDSSGRRRSSTRARTRRIRIFRRSCVESARRRQPIFAGAETLSGGRSTSSGVSPPSRRRLLPDNPLTYILPLKFRKPHILVPVLATICCARSGALELTASAPRECSVGGSRATVQVVGSTAQGHFWLVVSSEHGGARVPLPVRPHLLGSPSSPDVSVVCAPPGFALRYEVRFGNAYRILTDEFERHDDGRFEQTRRWLLLSDRQGFALFGGQLVDPYSLTDYDPRREVPPNQVAVFDSTMLEAFEDDGRLPAIVIPSLLHGCFASLRLCARFFLSAPSTGGVAIEPLLRFTRPDGFRFALPFLQSRVFRWDGRGTAIPIERQQRGAKSLPDQRAAGTAGHEADALAWTH